MTTSWTGLAAETWDCLGGDEPQWDCAYFRALVESQRGPALDVGCGTGRLLVRYLRDGLAVDGVDTSADMLALCRAKARTHGLEPTLHRQAMEALDLPTRYATIFVACGAFMLLLDDRAALTALRRFREHLVPDGVVALTFLGAASPPAPALGRWERRATGETPDGARVTMDVITDRHDPDTHVVESRRRYVLERDGATLREGHLVDRYRWYSAEHATRLVQEAGYRSWTASGPEPARAPAADDDVLVLLARR